MGPRLVYRSCWGACPMSRRALLPQSRRHVLVFDEDWAWLESAFGVYSPSRMGPGAAVRQIVHRYVKWLREREQGLLDASPALGPQPQPQADEAAVARTVFAGEEEQL